MNTVPIDIPPPEMFAKYEELINQALHIMIPFKNHKDIFDIHSYHVGISNSDGTLVGSDQYMGKCLRSTLCVFICEALGGNVDNSMQAAVALELIHNFSLIHDDIQDGDGERRHRPTVWSIWGVPKALVSGNALHTVGDMSVFKSNIYDVPEKMQIKLSNLLTEAYMKMIVGQCQDLEFENKTDITTDMYLGMIAGKTGALIQNAILMGALLGGKEYNTLQAFEEFGFLIGQAFQIRDDFLGIWGEESKTGKPIGNDIIRKKKTFPVVYGFENAHGARKSQLLNIYNMKELYDDDRTKVLQVLEDVGAKEATLDFIDEVSERAMNIVNQLEIPTWASIELKKLVFFLANRDL